MTFELASCDANGEFIRDNSVILIKKFKHI